MEPWLPPDNRTACWSQNGLASSRRSDENHSERKPKALQQPRSVPSSRNGRRAQTCSMGRAGRKKNSGHRRSVFFLTPFMEPWLPPDNRTACWSQNGLASSRRSDENHSERKPKALQQPRSVPSSRNGRRAQTCSMGRAGRKKNSGHRRSVFFLTPFMELNGHWESKPVDFGLRGVLLSAFRQSLP